MTDFEETVIEKLGKIETSVGIMQVDHGRRLDLLEEVNKTAESRNWIRSLVVGAAVVVGHPIARKLGLDI